jgi:hypothetical protein
MQRLREKTAEGENIPAWKYATSSHHVGTANGLHPEDDPPEEDDALYNTRLPSSVRRYHAPPTTAQTRTVMRVTKHHAPPQRASRQTTQAHQQTKCPPMQQAQRRVHWLFYLGAVMLAALVLSIAASSLAQWWHVQQDTWSYGYPRTFQYDADVKHGGISHFTVENLNGHIIIIETQINNLAQTKIYQGPVFEGPRTDLLPATIGFQDVNGDGYPDLILAVGTGRYIFINDHTGFRPTTPADKITGEVE